LKSFGAKFRAWDRDFGWTYRTAIFVGLLFALLSAPFWILRSGKPHSGISSHSGATHSQIGLSSGRVTADANAQDAQDTAELNGRPLYPYSIIPGGAYSREELTRAVQNDPVVARHYADFEVGKTRVVRLDHGELMYVSYRIGDNVFWTKHPLFVPAGEALLTDGKTVARTRCGNRLSSTPASPISPNQPSPEAMDVAPQLGEPAIAMHHPELSLALPPAALFPTPSAPGALEPLVNEGTIGGLPSPVPPVVFPIVGGGGPGTPIVPPVLPPPVATPEPSTMVLLLAGFGVVVGVWRRKTLLARKAVNR